MLTESQRIARKSGIGGSDMPIILGLSSYKTPYQLYLDKTSDDIAEDKPSQYAYWGNKLEPVIRDEFAHRHSVAIQQPDTIIHPIYDFLLANVDGFIPELDAVLEIKCSSSFMAHEWGDVGSDVIPMQYLVQVAHYCMVTGASSAYIAVLIGGNDYREYKYARDENLEHKLLEAASKFWECVKSKTPPEPINQVDLRLMYPRHNPEKTISIKPEIKEQLEALTDTKYKIKQLSEVEDQSKFHIMKFMQNAECLVDESGKPIVTWKATKSGSRTFLVK